MQSLMPRLTLGRAVRCAVLGRAQRCGRSRLKLFTWLLCHAEYLIQRFNKQLADSSQRTSFPLQASALRASAPPTPTLSRNWLAGRGFLSTYMASS
jgi:hypothetical protein